MNKKILLKEKFINFIEFIFFIIFAITIFSKVLIATDAPRIIILIGSPGAGKGTFSQLLKKYNYVHLSTGELLREQVQKKTEIGIKYKSEINEGKGVPWEIATNLIRDKIIKNISSGAKIILDGYPQSQSQIESLYKILIDHDLRNETIVLYLDIDKNVALSRLEGRINCSYCKYVYNLKSHPPKNINTCDHCNSALEKRHSDTEENMKKRIEKYFNNEDLYINLFKKYPDIRFKRINASNLYRDIPKKYVKLLKID